MKQYIYLLFLFTFFSIGCHYKISPNAIPDAEWTVLLYASADNNLERFILENMKEISEQGSANKIQWIVQMDRTPGASNNPNYSHDSIENIADFSTAKRFQVMQGGLAEIEDLGEIDMSDPAKLSDFITSMIRQFPAKKYMLILADHGSGSSFSADETNNFNHMLFSSIAPAIHSGLDAAGVKKLDILGFDACLEAEIHLAYSLRNVAKYYVASPELEPGAGWPYHIINQKMQENPTIDGKSLASQLPLYYQQYYENTDPDSANVATMTAIDVSELEILTEDIKALVAQIQSELDKVANGHPTASIDHVELAKARSNAVAYNYQSKNSGHAVFVDLGDILESLSQLSPLTVTAQAAKATYLKSIIQSWAGSHLKGATGLSIFFPEINIADIPNDTVFGESEFGKRSLWNEFLTIYRDAEPNHEAIAFSDFNVTTENGKEEASAKVVGESKLDHIGALLLQSTSDPQVFDILSLYELTPDADETVHHEFDHSAFWSIRSQEKSSPILAYVHLEDESGGRVLYTSPFLYRAHPSDSTWEEIEIKFNNTGNLVSVFFTRTNSEVYIEDSGNAEISPQKLILNTTKGTISPNLSEPSSEDIYPLSKTIQFINHHVTHEEYHIGFYATDYFNRTTTIISNTIYSIDD